jgi:hypothetical protein
MGGGHHHHNPEADPKRDQDIQALKDAKVFDTYFQAKYFTLVATIFMVSHFFP